MFYQLKDKSFKKSMAFDESLVGDVKGYLTRMSEFQNETMAAHELLEWLRAAWAPSSSPSSVQPGTDSIPGSPPGAVAELQPADCGGLQEVAELRFQSHRTIDETGQALGSMLQWFRGAYPYYHQKCLACGSDDTTRCGTLRSSAAEEAFKAGRTEIYHCPDCSAFSRFARYNELRKVLSVFCKAREASGWGPRESPPRTASSSAGSGAAGAPPCGLGLAPSRVA